MGRIVTFVYGLVAYAFFLVTFLYAIGFVTGLVVPKTIDGGTVVPLAQALFVNMALLSLFAVQHSVMARPGFKRWWTTVIPHSAERPTYVLLATTALALLLWQWRPIPEIVWRVADPQLAAAFIGLSLVGWLIVLLSTFMISHFELFGLYQVIMNLLGRNNSVGAVQDALPLQVRAPPDLSRFHHRVLGDAGHDRGASAVRSRDDRVHPRRHLPRGTRPGRNLRR